MAVPILNASLWLDASDLPKIDAVVEMLVQSVEHDAPILSPLRKVHLGAALVMSSGVAGFNPSPREIRGSTNKVWDDPASPVRATSISVVLNNIPPNPSEARSLKAAVPEFRLAMGALLAHEFTHVRQIEVGGGGLVQEIEAAVVASRKASASRDYADYIDYVAEPIEISAHATQLAYEVQAAIGPRQTQADFVAALHVCWLWNELQNRTDFQPQPGVDRKSLFAQVEVELSENAFWVYQRLWP